jgi:hypothetical protein
VSKFLVSATIAETTFTVLRFAMTQHAFANEVPLGDYFANIPTALQVPSRRDTTTDAVTVFLAPHRYLCSRRKQ